MAPTIHQRPQARSFRPFGAENRQTLIASFLKGNVEPAWQAVYRLLLWTDKTTGLAHCYESDKCQPGKPWHPRSLRFHGWLSAELGVPPRDVADGIDWLFRRTAEDYAKHMVAQYQQLLVRAARQRQPFAGLDFPEPGDDPAVVDIIREVLGDRLASEPSAQEWRTLTRRIRDLIAVDNKRKNLVGEGFEDVLSAVVRRFDVSAALDVRERCNLSTLPGFSNRLDGGKPNKVDLAILRPATARRTIVTAKWSIRADREKQFAAEFAGYVTAKSDHRPFDYVLLTNEFDPARLSRACEISAGHTSMFTKVVHINPQALLAVYGDRPEQTMQKVCQFVDERRIVGVDAWLESLIE